MAKQLIGHEWLQERMGEMGYSSLEQTATAMGINKGNLWRYFAFHNVPNMGLLPIMCDVLFCSPIELLRALQLLGPKQTL